MAGDGAHDPVASWLRPAEPAHAGLAHVDVEVEVELGHVKLVLDLAVVDQDEVDRLRDLERCLSATDGECVLAGCHLDARRPRDRRVGRPVPGPVLAMLIPVLGRRLRGRGGDLCLWRAAGGGLPEFAAGGRVIG